MKMNWLQMETRLRDVLCDVMLKESKPETKLSQLGLKRALQEISDIIGEETGRGYQLPENWWCDEM